MVRYYLFATVLVVGTGVLAVRHTLNNVPLEVASQAGAHPSPRPMSQAGDARPSKPFAGDAPWALAALPGCFEQTERIDGPPPYVRARMPRSLEPLAAGASLRSGECTAREAAGSLRIERGADRFVVPGSVRIFRLEGKLVTYRERGQLAELRTYRILR